jgi:hypothetical protein
MKIVSFIAVLNTAIATGCPGRCKLPVRQSYRPWCGHKCYSLYAGSCMWQRTVLMTIIGPWGLLDKKQAFLNAEMRCCLPKAVLINRLQGTRPAGLPACRILIFIALVKKLPAVTQCTRRVAGSWDGDVTSVTWTAPAATSAQRTMQLRWQAVATELPAQHKNLSKSVYGLISGHTWV